MIKQILPPLLIASFLLGCASSSVHKEIFRKDSDYNSREFSSSKYVLYNATVKAICAKIFILEKEDKENGFILAKRSFQRGRRTIVVILQAKITTESEGKTMLYLNALQTTERLYVADRTRFFMFIIPLPGGGGKEAFTVKEGEKAIEDKEFYREFFSAIEEKIEGSF